MRVASARVASRISHERLASAIARRLGISTASRAPVALMASGVARRFASARVHGIVASRVARGIGSAVTRKLIESGQLGLVDALASGIAKRVSTTSTAADLPVAEESAKSKT